MSFANAAGRTVARVDTFVVDHIDELAKNFERDRPLADDLRGQLLRPAADALLNVVLPDHEILAAVIAWGVYGYLKMPKRKDPEIPIRVCAVVCTWPGMSAEILPAG